MESPTRTFSTCKAKATLSTKRWDLSTMILAIQTPKAELEYMLGYVKDYRAVMGSDSAIQNSIDEIAALMQSTLYKLTFLK